MSELTRLADAIVCAAVRTASKPNPASYAGTMHCDTEIASTIAKHMMITAKSAMPDFKYPDFAHKIPGYCAWELAAWCRNMLFAAILHSKSHEALRWVFISMNMRITDIDRNIAEGRDCAPQPSLPEESGLPEDLPEADVPFVSGLASLARAAAIFIGVVLIGGFVAPAVLAATIEMISK